MRESCRVGFFRAAVVLRAEQVAQTRAASVAAGRRRFGQSGFRGTSVEDLAREARLTNGALYRHHPPEPALSEAVSMQAHTSDGRVDGGCDGRDRRAGRAGAGLRRVLDGVLQPDVQRILVLEGPAVLGLARYTDLDEKYATRSSWDR